MLGNILLLAFKKNVQKPDMGFEQFYLQFCEIIRESSLNFATWRNTPTITRQ